jgi:predicted Zn-dependent protease
MGNQLWASAHSRADEAAADQEAVKYLIATGIDPKGMVRLFEGLMAEERSDPSRANLEWFSSHPNTASRLQATVSTIARAMPSPQPRLASDNASYPFFLARMHMLPPAPPMIPMQHLPH